MQASPPLWLEPLEQVGRKRAIEGQELLRNCRMQSGLCLPSIARGSRPAFEELLADQVQRPRQPGDIALLLLDGAGNGLELDGPILQRDRVACGGQRGNETFR